jgi:hypothetical protein
MLERLHDHILNELGHSSHTDTIFIVVAVVFNLIVGGINTSAAGVATAYREPYGGSYSLAADVVLAVFILMTLLVNAIALVGLFVGRQTRSKLLNGLIAMYADSQVNKYYDRSLVLNYGIRYLLFGAVILLLAFTAIVVPLVIRLI